MVYLNFTIEDYKLYCMVMNKKPCRYETLIEFKNVVKMERVRIYEKNQ